MEIWNIGFFVFVFYWPGADTPRGSRHPKGADTLPPQEKTPPGADNTPPSPAYGQ